MPLVTCRGYFVKTFMGSLDCKWGSTAWTTWNQQDSTANLPKCLVTWRYDARALLMTSNVIGWPATTDAWRDTFVTWMTRRNCRESDTLSKHCASMFWNLSRVQLCVSRNHFLFSDLKNISQCPLTHKTRVNSLLFVSVVFLPLSVHSR